jgi:large subunit ribosomal protein L31
MKPKIHPVYYSEAEVVCASCGTKWTTGSTRKTLHIEVCSNCHPFFTGEQSRMLDVEGQVDRFYKKLQARQDYVEQQTAKENSKVSPNRPIAEAELGTRPTSALAKAGIVTVGQFLTKLAEGEDAILAVVGFGRKALIDSKKKLRALGYEVPGVVAEEAV